MSWLEVAVAEAVIVALLFVVVIVVANAARAGLREQARERNLMMNQILHLAGRTWQPPPMPDVAETPDETDRYIYAPSQLLDDEE